MWRNCRPFPSIWLNVTSHRALQYSVISHMQRKPRPNFPNSVHCTYIHGHPTLLVGTFHDRLSGYGYQESILDPWHTFRRTHHLSSSLSHSLPFVLCPVSIIFPLLLPFLSPFVSSFSFLISPMCFSPLSVSHPQHLSFYFSLHLFFCPLPLNLPF